MEDLFREPGATLALLGAMPALYNVGCIQDERLVSIGSTSYIERSCAEAWHPQLSLQCCRCGCATSSTQPVLCSVQRCKNYTVLTWLGQAVVCSSVMAILGQLPWQCHMTCPQAVAAHACQKMLRRTHFGILTITAALGALARRCDVVYAG